MRQRFEIHLDDLIQSWKNSTKEAIVGIIAVKENSKTTCDLKKPAAAPRPKKKPAQFAEAGTNTDPRITRKYQEKEAIVLKHSIRTAVPLLRTTPQSTKSCLPLESESAAVQSYLLSIVLEKGL